MNPMMDKDEEWSKDAMDASVLLPQTIDLPVALEIKTEVQTDRPFAPDPEPQEVPSKELIVLTNRLPDPNQDTVPDHPISKILKENAAVPLHKIENMIIKSRLKTIILQLLNPSLSIISSILKMTWPL